MRTALTICVGAAVCVFVGRKPSWIWEGALIGATASWVGWFAGRWLVVCHAWTMMGWFSGTLLRAVLPLLLSCSIALVWIARQHEDFGPIRGRFAVLVLLFWAGSAQFALWRLKAAHGFGPRSLTEAVGVAPANAAPLVSSALLRPSTTTTAGYEVSVNKAGIETVYVGGDNLIRLYEYLKNTDYQGVFAAEAMTALRKGWLFWWDADRALESAMLARPGRVAPDYLTALALLRAGPLTIERFQKLRALNELARDRKEGFEDVNRSQLIFEAFSAAYARFGDDEGSREWLYKVDKLWPIYEKRVEAAAVESFHDGEISGTLQPAGGLSLMVVGAFLVSTSTAATIARSTPTLSQSEMPDANGRFSFRDLGAGTYFLGLQGEAAALANPIAGSPGYIRLGPEAPAVHLDPIRVEP